MAFSVMALAIAGAVVVFLVAGAAVGLASGWSVVPSPNPTGPPSASLSGVSCVSVSDCTAVGAYTYGNTNSVTLVERWNGTRWSVVPTPNPTSAFSSGLSGVSCVSASDCTAVGDYYNTSPEYGGYATVLVEHWNGTGWSVVSTPNVRSGSALNGVSCVSASDCTAVGYSSGATLVERWDGTRWSVVPTPNPTGASGSSLSGVSCVSASDCTAVGYSSGATLVERWDGTRWSVVPTPNPTGASGSSLSGVSCVSASDCTAVGNYYNGHISVTLAERWNGTGWSVVPTPNPTGAPGASLSGVSCAVASDCTAVGSYSTRRYNDVTLAERWNGTAWSVVPTPNPTRTFDSGLSGVSCVSANACTAVGEYANGFGTPFGTFVATLAERWNGTGWSIKPTPFARNHHLTGVSCVSASDCTAVGYYRHGSDYVPLVERWNGTRWSITNAPGPTDASGSYPLGVSCVSASDCTAVGYYYNGHIYVPLVERWNGTGWSVVPTHPTGGSRNVLNGVSCASANACTAVGSYYNNSDKVTRTLVERWNGSRWSVRHTPNPPGGTRNVLNGVSCASANACTAVGSYYNGSKHVTLAERWNGTRWSIRHTANPTSPRNSGLSGVSCVSANNCTAVGSSYNRTNSVTLAERWNGTAWSVMPTPNSTWSHTSLSGVSCVSASDCTAVGSYYNGHISVTLVERWRAG